MFFFISEQVLLSGKKNIEQVLCIIIICCFWVRNYNQKKNKIKDGRWFYVFKVLTFNQEDSEIQF